MTHSTLCFGCHGPHARGLAAEVQQPPANTLRRAVLRLCLRLLQVWDVALQHCSQTLTGFKGEVWSLDVDPQEARLVAGCVDADLRVFAIRAAAEGAAAAAAAATGQVEDSEDSDDEQQLVAAAAAAGQQQPQPQPRRRQHDLLQPLGLVRRTGQERVARLRYNGSGQLLGVMGAGKGLEIFRCVWRKGTSGCTRV
jgi:U3 small nucleolar RNA-associated protein 12